MDKTNLAEDIQEEETHLKEGEVIDISHNSDKGIKQTESGSIGAYEERSDVITEIAHKMKLPDNTLLLAENFSILENHERALKMDHPIKLYILLWPLFNLVALYVFFKVSFFRLLNLRLRNGTKEEKIKFLFGPKKGTIFFDGLHPFGYIIRNGTTTSSALDVVYNILEILRPKKINELLFYWYSHYDEAYGIRNRLRATYSCVYDLIEENYLKGRNDFNGLILACGSSQAEIEVVSNLRKKYIDITPKIKLVDLNKSSLKMAKRLIKTRNVMDSFEIIEGYVGEFLRTQEKNSLDLIEVVGLVDYKEIDFIQKLANECFKVLKPGGKLIISTTAPTIWSFFTRWAINWPLLKRRSLKEFLEILQNTKFNKKDLKLFYVLTKCHVMAICTKNV